MITESETAKKVLKYPSNQILYVAGIPAKISRAPVVKFFKELGASEVLDIHRRAVTDKKMERRPFEKGCCLLYTPDKNVFQSLLGREVVMEGRTLQIFKYLVGDSLIIYKKTLNKRRVVLKKVPKSLDLCSLTRNLEDRFGKIAYFYQYNSQNPAKQLQRENSLEYLTFSVIFDYKVSSLMASKSIEIEVEGNTIIIEAYQKNKSLYSGYHVPIRPTNYSELDQRGIHRQKRGSYKPVSRCHPLQAIPSQIRSVGCHPFTRNQVLPFSPTNPMPYSESPPIHSLRPTMRRYYSRNGRCDLKATSGKKRFTREPYTALYRFNIGSVRPSSI